MQKPLPPGEVVYSIVTQLPEVAIAKDKNLASCLSYWRGWGWPLTPESPLINRALCGAITGYVDGTLDWTTCEAWHSTPEGADWLKHVADWELRALILPSSSLHTSSDETLTGARSRAWRWLAYAPDSLYSRKPSILGKLTEVLAAPQNRGWDQTMTDHWIMVLQRASRHESEPIRLQLFAHALNFAFAHHHDPVSLLIVESFWPVYDHLTRAKDEAHEVFGLFSFFDWDKGKELRREIASAFQTSNWPPGDLVLAIPEDNLLRKVFKRIRRERGGEAYIDAILADLAKRHGPKAQKGRKRWLDLARHPDFFEPWI